MSTQNVMAYTTDTNPDTERVQIELFRRASVARRVAIARSLSRTTLQLAQRAVRRAYPEASDREHWLVVVAAQHGKALADHLRQHALVMPACQWTPFMNDFLVALLGVVDLFDQLGIPYYVRGSLASSAYGIARATADVDLVADVRAEQVPTLVKQLHAEYYIDAAMIYDAIARRASFNLLHLATMVKLDVFLPKQRAFDAEVARRTQQDTLEEAPSARLVNILSPEDVILTKLEWYRAGNQVSERQWNDVLGVLKVQGELLDRAYLQQWATVLQVTDLLERAFQEASL